MCFAFSCANSILHLLAQIIFCICSLFRYLHFNALLNLLYITLSSLSYLQVHVNRKHTIKVWITQNCGILSYKVSKVLPGAVSDRRQSTPKGTKKARCKPSGISPAWLFACSVSVCVPFILYRPIKRECPQIALYCALWAFVCSNIQIIVYAVIAASVGVFVASSAILASAFLRKA